MSNAVSLPVTVRAAMLIIGNEILSGRTVDANLAYAAVFLNNHGIIMSEARIVADERDAIISALNALRKSYDYVFTSGGIGPTHDDITSDCIAESFGVPCERSDEAVAAMAAYYGGPEHLTETRLRMARMPRGSLPIENPVSGAPGFQMLNVFALAGVPRIQQAMLHSLAHRLHGGDPLTTHTLRADTGESAVADLLRAAQNAHSEVNIGSYPGITTEGKPLLRVVCRSADVIKVYDCMNSIKTLLQERGIKTVLETCAEHQKTHNDDEGDDLFFEDD